MKIEDLKTGMRLIMRNGYEFIVLKNVETPYRKKQDMYVDLNGGWMSSGLYNEDLTAISDHNFDIMEIYAQNNGKYLDGNVLKHGERKNMDLIWSRNDKKEMTISEIEKELGYSIKIIKEDQSTRG